MSDLAGTGLGSWTAVLVRCLHLALVAFAVWAPFSGSRTALALHLVGMPFLWAHWLLNDDTCVLTVLEKALRGVDDGGSFFHALVSPVYGAASDVEVRGLVWAASVALWLVTCWRVARREESVASLLLGISDG